jgi:hypothetical protein
MTHCSKQLQFPFFCKKALIANFEGGELTTDAGLLLVRQYEHRRNLIGALSKAIEDPRDPRFIRHTQEELLRQRIFQIVAGYEDCNDASRLRRDGLFKVVVGRLPSDAELGSQPTLSRLENRIGDATARELRRVMLHWFVQSRPELPAEMTLDIDASHFVTYGQQVLAFFNGKYNEYGYFPLFVTHGESGYLLSAVLRPGNEARPIVATNVLDEVVGELRGERPDIRLLVRGDSHFGTPLVFSWLEDHGIGYAIGMTPNSVLERSAAPFVHAVEERFRKTAEPQRAYTSFKYAAGSWHCKRRILVKVEVTSLGTNVRFLVTNRGGRSADLFEWANQRGGTVEHAIDELKNDFSGDRLSCHEFEANAFRLLLHTAAYNLMILFREEIAVKTLATVEMATLRIKLLKVAGRIRETARRIWVELSSSWPYADLFEKAHRALVPIPGSG